MKPTFFIIGAPKCGTTSLTNWLRENPQVFMPAEKEPCFFSPDLHPSLYVTLEAYEALFDRATRDHVAVGEASTTYLESEVAVPRLLEYQPDAKLIVMLRSPVKMAISLHAQELSVLNEEIDSFEVAWDAQEDRAAGRRIPKYCRSAQTLAYGERCKLGKQLARLYSRVDRDRVHLVFLEDVKSDPELAYRGVTEFLGIEAEPLPDFTPANTRHIHRSRWLMRLIRAYGALTERIGFRYQTGVLKRVREWNRRDAARSLPGVELRRQLVEYFEPDVRLLEQLTGRDLSHWLT